MKRQGRKRLRFSAALLILGQLACASARMSDHKSDGLFREGRYDEAVASLAPGLKDQGENGRDLLLYLLDIGLSLHAAGKLEESNRYFLRADKIAEIKDYTSIATEGATLVTSDNIKDYKGEDFEKVLINAYLAMNYALMGDFENALVEAKRVNRKLHLMVTEGERKYKQNAFARYLSAVMYEAAGEYNDAYIDYKKTWELEPATPGLGGELWRMAWLLSMDDQMERWQKEFSLTEADLKAARALHPKKGKGEIIVLYENGISPVKRPNPQFNTLPKFYPRYNPVLSARVTVAGTEGAETYRLHDIEATAIQNLDEKYGGLIAKKLAGIVAKEAAGAAVEKATDSPVLGFLTKVALYVSDQADVRSWNLLPRDLQISRIVVDPGLHTVRVDPVGAGALPEKTVQVGAGRKVFVNFRYTPAR